jgi:asparagine synthase (glutamine-hydrolysing)
LEGRGRDGLRGAGDAELILHAYHAWGEQCVEHLLGDFAFAIWDGRRRRLFCPRDHFGIKPFFYALVGDCLVFSNTLNCVRLHPTVSEELNDRAVGDFLLFGGSQEKDTTAFADVRRLPPAHTLQWCAGRPRLGRYWVLPAEEEIRYRRAGDYVAHFTELFRAAVGDRLRADRVTVLMSGGLDSSSVAAVARGLAASRPTPIDLRARTHVFDRVIPDRERHHAGAVARALDIPIDYLVADDYGLFERWDEPELYRPEPFEGAVGAALMADQFRGCAAHSRVAITGLGADPVQFGSPTYLLNLLKAGRWGRAVADCWQSVRHGRLPKAGLRTWLRRWLGRRRWQFPYPEWLDGDFARRLRLADRLREANQARPVPHRSRPEAYRTLLSCDVHNWFDQYDPGWTGCGLEVRHPYLDVRVVRFFLAIPPVPWCDNKALVRQAMRGSLPDSIRLRPKAVLAGSPAREALGREESRWVDHFVPTAELSHYVNRAAVPALAGETNLGRIWTHLRPLSLQFWLRSRNAFRDTLHRRARLHETATPEEALPRAEARCLR